jgi:mannobiose 2-epimerase
MSQRLTKYKKELEKELENILNYWVDNTLDEGYGGFVGRIDNSNKVIPGSPKGSVLNARILWSFAAAYNQTKNALYLGMAAIAYRYIATYFIDEEYGGVYWTVDHEGKPLDTKKQVYASAFTIYALSEFYKATKDKEVLAEAKKLYQVLVDNSYDSLHTGYLEAFTRDWRTNCRPAPERKGR